MYHFQDILKMLVQNTGFCHKFVEILSEIYNFELGTKL